MKSLQFEIFLRSPRKVSKAALISAASMKSRMHWLLNGGSLNFLCCLCFSELWVTSFMYNHTTVFSIRLIMCPQNNLLLYVDRFCPEHRTANVDYFKWRYRLNTDINKFPCFDCGRFKASVFLFLLFLWISPYFTFIFLNEVRVCLDVPLTQGVGKEHFTSHGGTCGCMCRVIALNNLRGQSVLLAQRQPYCCLWLFLSLTHTHSRQHTLKHPLFVTLKSICDI